MTQEGFDSLQVGDIVRLRARNLNDGRATDRTYACRYGKVHYVSFVRRHVTVDIEIKQLTPDGRVIDNVHWFDRTMLDCVIERSGDVDES